MLILSRKVGEKVIIDSETAVEVLAIRGDKIRIGFTAPKEVVIHRAEVQRAIDAQHQSGLIDPPSSG